MRVETDKAQRYHCPLTYPNPSNNYGWNCHGDKCMWWEPDANDSEYGQCSISLLSRSAFVVKKQFNNLCVAG